MKEKSETKADITTEVEALHRKVTELEALCNRYELLIDKISKAKKAWEKTFDVVPDYIAVIGKDHSILRINRSMADILGLPPEQCIGKKCYQLIHGTTEAPFFCPHIRTMRDAREHRIEIYEESLGGTTLITTSPFTEEDGNLIGSVHVAYDITAEANLEECLLEINRDIEDTNKNLKIAYQSMRRSRDILRTYNYEQDICFLVDRQGQVKFMSERALLFTGKTLSDLTGSKVTDLFAEANQGKIFDAMKEAWLGIVYPVKVESITAQDKLQEMIMKLTRMSSPDFRWLLLTLQYVDEDGRQQVSPDLSEKVKIIS
ncbi:MAG: hypothetical protein CSYNP_02701 [Syntrophus sp. SKADARSKE-3]|nr:hypothetical protein [Syntrophus sp. SKADARSKE-3]